MKQKLSLICLVVFSLTQCPCFASFSDNDEDPGDKAAKKKKAKDNGIDLMFPRAKFFELTYRNYPYAQASPSGESNDGDEEGEGHVIKTRLRFPMILSSKFKLIGQVGYQHERIHIPEEAGDFGNVAFQKLGFTLIGEQKLKNDKFLLGVVSASSRSEKRSFKNMPSPNSFGASFVVGKEYGDYNKLGFGVASGVNMGRVSVSPVVTFSKRIDQRNFIDAMLPRNITYRHLMSNKFYFYSSIEANNFNYSFADRVFQEVSDLEVRRTELAFNMGLEREIHDWLWMSFEMGLTKPLRNVIIEQGERSRHYLSSFNDHIQPVISLSLFAVIPQSIVNKLRR